LTSAPAQNYQLMHVRSVSRDKLNQASEVATSSAALSKFIRVIGE
ncbi:5754_t:CDS:1, partial [Racocetra persica]